MAEANGSEVVPRLESSIGELSGIVDADLPGWSRTVFSEPYRASRGVVASAMDDSGLSTSVDAAGNLVGSLPGRVGGPPIVLGSHTDTVVGGGRFDGVAGVMSAIETVRALRSAGTVLRHDLVVVDFLGEEPNTYGSSCVGSRALAGQLTTAHLDRHDGTTSLGTAMQQFGLDPNAALACGWEPGSVHAFLELHVEQGPGLERAGRKIGVVTAIAGIERVAATFAGRADHAGTMPMADRTDALTAAAEAVLQVERVGCGAPVPAVTTTGRLEVVPGSFNVVPERATMWAELRSVDAAWLTGARRDLVEQLAADAARRGVHVDVDLLATQEPVPATECLQDVIAARADDLGLAWQAVPSGAGHDAAHMAHLGPMAMVFVPSRDGRSHCPEEWTDYQDIAGGVQVLVETVRAIDEMDSCAY